MIRKTVKTAVAGLALAAPLAMVSPASATTYPGYWRYSNYCEYGRVCLNETGTGSNAYWWWVVDGCGYRDVPDGSFDEVSTHGNGVRVLYPRGLYDDLDPWGHRWLDSSNTVVAVYVYC